MSSLPSDPPPPDRPSSNHALPAVYVAHLHALVHQSLLAAGLAPDPWEREIVEGVRSVPLRRWTDLLGKSMRERETAALAHAGGGGHEHEAAAPSAGGGESQTTPQGSPGRPSLLSSASASSSRHPSYASATPSQLGSTLAPPSTPSTASSSGFPSPSTPAQPHSATTTQTPAGADLAPFVARIANFQRYPPPIEFDATDGGGGLFASARGVDARPRAPAGASTGRDGRDAAHDHVPGAFPRPDGPSGSSASGSLGALSLPNDDDDERAQLALAEQDRLACAGRRAVLGLSVWWRFAGAGEQARVRFVEGEWALPPAPTTTTTLPAGSQDRGTMDGLPGRSLADKFLPPGPPSPQEHVDGSSPLATYTAASGDILYGLAALNTALDPDAYHLFGGTLVVTLPLPSTPPPTSADPSPSAPASAATQTAIQKILRIAVYAHASAVLEVALLDAHGRPPLPPPARPSLFRGFSESTARSTSHDGRSSVDGSERAGADSSPGWNGRGRGGFAEGDAEGKWRRRKAKLSKTWGGLLGALTGTAPSGPPSPVDKDCATAASGADAREPRDRMFSGSSTVVVEGPPSSITRRRAPAAAERPTFLAPPSASSTASSRSASPDGHNKDVSVSSSSSAAAAAAAVPTMPAMDKFSRSVAAIQDNIFSTTPGLCFPPPPLLVRLRDAETRAALAPAASTSSYLTRQDASAVAHAFAGPSKESVDGKRLGERAPEGFRLTAEARAGIGCLMIGNGGLEAFGRHQSISVLYQVLPASHPTVSKTSLMRTPAPTPPRSPAPSTSSLDPLFTLSKPPNLAGLPASLAQPLSSSTASAAAGLPTGSAPATTAPPTWLTLPYFSHAAGGGGGSAGVSAGSLGQVIRTLSDEAERGVVEDHVGVHREGGEWVRAWMHSGVRVEALSRRGEHRAMAGGEDEEEIEGVLVRKEGEGVGDGIVRCWVEDVETGACSEVRSLSEGAESVSFAKYLELLIYSDQLFPPSLAPSSAACFTPAATMSATPLLRHYQLGDVTTTVSVSPFDLYEIRLGKLTVGPAKIPRGTAGGAGADEDAACGAGADKEPVAVEETRAEIKAFYAAVEKQLGRLKAQHLPPSPSQAFDKPLPGAPSTAPLKSPAIASSAYAALHRLSRQLHDDEDRLLDALRSTPASHLNDVRTLLADAVKSAQAAMGTWELAWGEKDEAASAAPPALPVPDYVSNIKTHLLPGSAVLFNEDEPASFIAATLSNPEYVKELSKVKLSGLTSGATTPRAEEKGFSLSAAVTPTPSLLRAVTTPAPAPAAPPTDGAPSSDYSTVVTRIDHPKDFSNAIFSLRGLPTLPKKRSDASLSLASPGILPGRAGSLFKTAPANEPTVTLGSAEGTMSVGDPFDKLVKEISRTGVSDAGKTGRDVPDPKTLADLPHANPAHRTPDAKAAVRPLSALSSLPDMPLAASGTVTPTPSTGPSTPRHPEPESGGGGGLLGLGLPSSATKPARRAPGAAPPPSAASSGLFSGWSSIKDESWTSSITSSIGSLSAFVGIGPGSGSTLRGGRKEPASRASSAHGLLVPDHAPPTVPIEDKPHVVLSTTIGTPKKGLEVSCTVFYASAFHLLRTRLGIDKAFADSLAQARPWDAVGGKSKALFFKTCDDRYIVKELVSRWNLSDSQALLEIAPAYFDFILGAAAVKPTSFAKILGFYEYKLTDRSTGSSRKVELIVLENLFFDQAVSRTFDLKGIEGRRVRAAPAEAAQGEVGHDQEWREGQQATLLLVHPHAKRILKEAIANDTRFLATNNVIDFSMLVGVDEDKKELVLGLVDAIGAYTVFKALESKGKLLANKGGDVTVIPPEQYSARFEAAMDSYFVAAPDKWTTNPSKAAAAKAVRAAIPSVF